MRCLVSILSHFLLGLTGCSATPARPNIAILLGDYLIRRAEALRFNCFPRYRGASWVIFKRRASEGQMREHLGSV